MASLRRSLHFRRYRQIAEVFAHHGLGALAGFVGLDRFLPFHRGFFGHPYRAIPYSRPEHVRMALEELGTTFIKLGQMLSTRADLLSPDYQAELAKLQDAAPPVPSDVIENLIVADLGRPISEIFATFDPVPLAAASIGQVHAATLPDGTEVVVKVRRPGVVEEVEEDLEILLNLAGVASRRWRLAEHYDVVGLAQEFAQTVRAEMDYVREGRNAERFAASFQGEPAVHIPRVFWETTAGRVLTLERLYGIKIYDIQALTAAGIDRKALAERAARLVLKMVFEDGFFHADPHPGNFFVEPSGRIGLIDFGMVGTVDERTQEQLAEVLLAIAEQNVDRLLDTLLELGIARWRVNRNVLRRDIEHLMMRYYGLPLGHIAVGPLINDGLEVARRHHLRLPPNLALLLKTVVMNEGLGARLDPTFRLPVVLVPYAKRLLVRLYSPKRWARRLGESALDGARLWVGLPQQLRRILGEFERGGVEVSVRPDVFDPALSRLERIANRIVLGIIAAAFVNSLAVLSSVYRPSVIERWAGIAFAVGFLFAVVLGVYLAWSIVRSGRG